MVDTGARLTISRVALFVAMVSPTLADVSPPVKITLAPGAGMAATGILHSGEFLIDVGDAGDLHDFAVRGPGWNVIQAVFPPEGFQPAGARLSVAFSAIPEDPDQPLQLRFRHNGHTVKRAFGMGPAAAARAARPGTLWTLGPSGTPTPQHPSRTITEASLPPPGPRGGAIPLRFHGRLVYQREDGLLAGADNIRVRVMDDDGLPSDALVDELIWMGRTDEEGFFDSGVIMWDDCDITGCDDPDIYVHFDCNTEIAQVQTAGNEANYFWRTMDNIIEDFTGDEVDFGTLMPGDGDDGAIHIWNSIIRAHRFILDRSGISLPIVDVQWPESGSGAYYNSFFEEIHVSEAETWDESTHTHEYGHHFLENRAVNPSPDYCNGFCDGAGPGCDFDEDCADEGHCTWCRETAHDAFNEGWPDWLSDAITRDYPNRYVFADGTTYAAMNQDSYENLRNCCVDDLPHDPVLTEGFVAALLRDIEDGTQDDHDGDGIFDLMCKGPEEILFVTDQYDPVTVLDFISAFRLQYSLADQGDLWATAFNVGGAAYVVDFGTDFVQPGLVEFMDSLSHPLGIGGSLPCIEFEFTRAEDWDSGACTYSYIVTSNPGGMEPDEVPDWVVGAAGCQLRGAVGVFQLGDFYISIKARDNAGNWDLEYATFGPFTILDCNGSGFLDVCDINCCGVNCNVVGTENCTADSGVCPPGACGISSDCNGNYIPDECDIADGRSEDCNGDGIPDECQPDLKHYSGLGASPSEWADPANWLDNNPPVDDDMVCIPSSAPTLTVIFQDDYLRLGSLSCEKDFAVAGPGNPTRDLELTGDSFIRGDLAVSGTGTLVNDANLSVDGALNWASGTIRNNGTTTVAGGMNLTSGTVTLGTNQHLIISGGAASAGTRTMTMQSGAMFTIGSGVTYTYTGDFNIFNGGASSTVNVDGTLLRTTGTNLAVPVYAFVNNSGLIHNQSGGLLLGRGGVHTGTLLGDPGTLLRFSSIGAATTEFEPASTLTADDAQFQNTCNLHGNATISGTLTVNGGVTTVASDAHVTDFGDIFVQQGELRIESPVSGGPNHLGSVVVGENTSGGKVLTLNTGHPMSIDSLTLVQGNVQGADPITISDTFVWAGGGAILSGGALTLTGATTIQNTSSQRTLYRPVNHTGYFTMLGSFSPSNMTFTNLPTGTIDMQADRGFSLSSSSTLVNNGTMLKTAGSGNSSIACHFRNAGTVEVRTGRMVFTVGDYNITGIQTAGHMILNGGGMEFFGSGFFDIQGGDLRGSGEITGRLQNNGGRVRPGLSAGALTITGNYTQSTNGALDIEIGGAGAGEFDVLSVSGTATLGGELNIANINGYSPAGGHSFVILTAGTRSGTFASVTGAPGYSVSYTPTEVILTADGAPLPGDLDGDCDVDISDLAVLLGSFGTPSGATYSMGDLDGDGDVDISDLSVLLSAFGSTC